MDTKELPLFVMATPTDMTDRDAAKEVLFRLRLMYPEITIVWADSGYAGQLVNWAKVNLGLTLKAVSRPENTPRVRHPAPPPGRRALLVSRVECCWPRPSVRPAGPAAPTVTGAQNPGLTQCATTEVRPPSLLRTDALPSPL